MIDEKLGSGVKSGYQYNSSGTVNENQFAFTADPQDDNHGVRHFFIDHTYVLRFSMDGTADSSSAVLD